MIKPKFLATLLLLTSTSAAVAGADVWEIDPAHSSVGFRVKHMMVSTVAGSFGAFSGTVQYDTADLAKSSVAVEIDAASINTNIDKRDEHLRSADFFDTAKYPSISFKSTKVEKGASPDVVKVTGDFTMHGVTRPVVLEVTKTGPVGGRMGFAASTRINRKDFGLTYNKVLETGGVALSEEVDVVLDIAAVQPKPAESARK